LGIALELAQSLNIDWQPPQPDPYADLPLTAQTARTIESHETFQGDPVDWCESLGLELWSKQIEISDACSEHRYISCRSCNSSGKTQLAAALGLHYAFKHQHEDAIVGVLSSGWDNLRTGIWRRMSELKSNWDLPGKLIQKSYTIGGKELISFRSPPKGQEASRKLLQGLHARYMFIIVDEANEIPLNLWSEMLSTASGKNVVVLALGNPTAAGTPFEATFKPDSKWHNIHISFDMMPAVTGEPVSEAASESLLTYETVDLMLDDLPEYEIAARIHGEFPTESQLAFFRLNKIDEAMDLQLKSDAKPIYALDPGSGGDPSVLTRRCGHVIELVDLGDYRVSDDRDAVAEHVAGIVREGGGRAIIVDTFGLGADHAVMLSKLLAPDHIPVVSLNTGDTSKLCDPEQFVNPRAELSAELRRLTNKGLVQLPKNEKLRAQMRAIRGKPHPSGKVALESKEDFKKRFGHSCDELDSITLSLFETIPLDPTNFSSIMDILSR